MFAGIPELFIILIVVFAAWHVVKAFKRMQAPPPPRRRSAPASAGSRPMIEAEDLVACKVCGAYIATSARHCGRTNCPQPR